MRHLKLMEFFKRYLLFFFIIFFFTSTTLSTEVVKVVDGDTIHIGNTKYRLFGIDAPELSQQCKKDNKTILCGVDAKKMLENKIGKQTPKCISQTKDKYNRVVAECFIQSESLSSYMVRSGYAVAYKKYSSKFVEDEKYAKNNKLGIWSTKFQNPEEFRRYKSSQK